MACSISVLVVKNLRQMKIVNWYSQSGNHWTLLQHCIWHLFQSHFYLCWVHILKGMDQMVRCSCQKVLWIWCIAHHVWWFLSEAAHKSVVWNTKGKTGRERDTLVVNNRVSSMADESKLTGIDYIHLFSYSYVVRFFLGQNKIYGLGAIRTLTEKKW